MTIRHLRIFVHVAEPAACLPPPSNASCHSLPSARQSANWKTITIIKLFDRLSKNYILQKPEGSCCCTQKKP